MTMTGPPRMSHADMPGMFGRNLSFGQEEYTWWDILKGIYSNAFDGKLKETVDYIYGKISDFGHAAIDEMLMDERAEGRAEGEAIGEARGLERGRNEGILHTLIDLVNKNIITKEIAAVQANMSVDEFMAYI